MQANHSTPGFALAARRAFGTPLIAHLDMDCFFAQVEQQRRPELEGKPVVVGADPHHGHGRGVVCTANYEARKYGIQSAMPISQAWKRCPDAVFLPVDYRHYSAVSRHIFSIAGQFGTTERTGIDEGYVDLGGTGDVGRAEETAQQIKAAIREKTGLTCSIGIAWNKAMAKLAAGLQKPDGLTLIRPSELQAKIWPLAAEKLIGVGPQTKARLDKAGIATIGDISRAKPRFLAELMGSWGLYLHAAANGNGSTELGGFWQPKSISRETTFAQDTDNWVDLRLTLEQLCRCVHADAVSENAFFRTVGVKIRLQLRDAHARPQPQINAGAGTGQSRGQRTGAARVGIRTQNPARRRARERLDGCDGAEKVERILEKKTSSSACPSCLPPSLFRPGPSAPARTWWL